MRPRHVAWLVVAVWLPSLRLAHAICTAADAGMVCRVSAGACDPAEVCPVGGGVCPPDARTPNGTICRSAPMVCDQAETCDGSSVDCPADGFKSSSTLCRGVNGPCDVAENCTGSGPSCPNDLFLDNSSVCRPASGTCDVEERCGGSAATCPTNAFVGNDTPCQDGMSCTVGDSCQSGVCQGGGPPLTVAPVPVEFPETLVNGAASTASVVVTYHDQSTLSITAIAPSVADFRLAPSVTLPIVLSSGTPQVTIPLEFVATALGARGGTLALTLDPATCAPPTVSLAGHGLPPGVSLSPSSADFGAVMVGATSVGKEIRVVNLSEMPVTVTSVMLADGTHFQLTAGGLPADVPVGGTYAFTVEGHPQALGAHMTTVVATTNHPSFASLTTQLLVEGSAGGGDEPDAGGPGVTPTASGLTPLSCSVHGGAGFPSALFLLVLVVIVRRIYRRS